MQTKDVEKPTASTHVLQGALPGINMPAGASNGWTESCLIMYSPSNVETTNAHVILLSYFFDLAAGYNLPADVPALYEEVGGILAPEKMIQAHCKVAQYHGATIKTGEQVSVVLYLLLRRARMLRFSWHCQLQGLSR